MARTKNGTYQSKSQKKKTSPSKKSSRKKVTLKSRGPKYWLRKLIYWGLVAGVWAFIAFLVVLGTFAYDLPNPSGLNLAAQTGRITVLDRLGNSLNTQGTAAGKPITLDEVPEHMKQAVIATEDRRFYSHFGIDPIGLTRAMVTNVLAGRIVQGGSTLTQQLAKNAFLTHERSIKRKVQEALLAIWLERHYSKDEILTFYLNRVYLGGGAYGLDAASRRYFGHAPSKLSVMESAMIAGLLKAPSRYAPSADLKRSRERGNVVLANMRAVGYLDENGVAQAKAEKIRIQSRSATLPSSRYFTDWVLDSLTDYIGETDRPLVVRTSIDPVMQAGAARALKRHLDASGKTVNASQGAIVILDDDGAVRAMVGGRSYAESQYNRAILAQRQPGSAFKSFVYAAAFNEGLSPDTVMRDSPITLDGWSPRNYNKEFRGEVDLRTAFAKSINTVAVKLSERAGRQKVINMAHRLGITSDIPAHPSLALGTADVGVLEIAQAYVPFANGGNGVMAYGIIDITMDDGTVLYSRSGGLGQVLSSRLVTQMADVFQETVKVGTGRLAAIKGRTVRGKTGTSQDFRDAWFVGFADGLTTTVWIGNDNASPMKRVSGAGLPAKVWRDTMVTALKDREVRSYPPSAGDLIADQASQAVSAFQSLLGRLTRSLGQEDDDSGTRKSNAPAPVVEHDYPTSGGAGRNK